MKKFSHDWLYITFYSMTGSSIEINASFPEEEIAVPAALQDKKGSKTASVAIHDHHKDILDYVPPYLDGNFQS